MTSLGLNLIFWFSEEQVFGHMFKRVIGSLHPLYIEPHGLLSKTDSIPNEIVIIFSTSKAVSTYFMNIYEMEWSAGLI